MPPQHHNPHRADFWEHLFENSLPRAHLYAAGAVALLITALLVIAPSGDVSAYRETHLERLVRKNQLMAELPRIEAMPAMATAETGPDSTHPDLIQLDETVKAGDNLSAIFKRLSLSQNDVHALANASEFAEELRKLAPGNVISVVLDTDRNIREVVYERSRMESFRFKPTNAGYGGEKLVREPETRTSFKEATISRSLFQDGIEAGLSPAQLMEIANIFGWDIDFALDIRKGDEFRVLFEEEYIDGERVGSGKILTAEFTNQGRTYEAVHYEDEDGNSSFYTPDGLPMKKAFLQAPVDFTRVSSNYNPNRLHPIFKTKRPHRGVDYAAPTGTPVYAAGDGTVVKAGYTRANGNYVFIQHGDTYTTRYLHLHKIAVKTGQKVSQRDIIGSVGSTGYATGPHLHYEFLINGSHTNPRTVKLPRAIPIAESEMARFKEQTAPVLAEFEQFQRTQLATAQQ